MNNRTTDQREASRSRSPYLVIALLAAVLGMLAAHGAASVLDVPEAVILLAGAAWGLLWTFLASRIAARLGRRETEPDHAPNVTALLLVIACMVPFTTGLVQHLMFPTPETYLAMQQSGAADGGLGIYATVNPLIEWVLLPLALFYNWPTPRRRLVLIAAAVFYFERLLTYLYFAPTVVSWQDKPFTQELLDQASVWLPVDWSRMLLDAAAIVLVSLVTFLPLKKRALVA